MIAKNLEVEIVGIEETRDAADEELLMSEVSAIVRHKGLEEPITFSVTVPGTATADEMREAVAERVKDLVGTELGRRRTKTVAIESGPLRKRFGGELTLDPDLIGDVEPKEPPAKKVKK